MSKIHLSHEQWLQEAERRYGPKLRKLRFRCPACGHVQSGQDFIDLGMSPEQAAQRVGISCIGRWMPAAREAFGGQAELRQAEQQYRAASKDHPYTAIRPVAVKTADLPIKAGVEKSGGVAIGPSRRTKAYDFSRASLRVKSLSEGLDVLESHPALELLENPNPHYGQWALLYMTAFSLEATGSAVWWIDETPSPRGAADQAARRQLWYLPKSWVQPVHRDGRLFAEWKLQLPGVPDDAFPPIPGDRICHFCYPNPADPNSPHSPLQSQAKAINTDDAIQTAQSASMKNAAKPGMIVIAGELDAPPGGVARRPEFTPEQRSQLIAAVRLAYSGPTHNGEPIILDNLIKDVKPYMANPADLDFPNGSGLTKDRIFLGIGTNPIVAGQFRGEVGGAANPACP